MGLGNSKSPLERQKTILRRSQRKSIYGTKNKIQSINKEIVRYKGTDPTDDKFLALQRKIEAVRKELQKKSTNLLPEMKSGHEAALKSIDDTDRALMLKLKNNRSGLGSKVDLKQRVLQKLEQLDLENEEENNEYEVEEQPSPEPPQNDSDEEEDEHHHKTVELKSVQFTEPNHAVEVHNNSESKRASILKMGVPIMAQIQTDAIINKSQKISAHYRQQYDNSENDTQNPEAQMREVNDVIDALKGIEYEIHHFVDKKNSVEYNRIKEQLNRYLIRMNQIESFQMDEEFKEQVKLCKNYISSNMNFLDERAITLGDDDDDDEAHDNDDVFSNTSEATNASNILMKSTMV